jgi:purine-binding chemotaxis protein CheW
MTVQAFDISHRVADLRRAFDETFAAAPERRGEQTEDLLAFTIARDSYALRIDQLTGLLSTRKIVPLPSRTPGLIGLAGVRGSVVPVYSLARILGYEVSDPSTRWLALSGHPESVALAFDELEGFLRVERSRVGEVPRGSHAASRSYIRGAVRVGDVTRMLIDAGAAVTALSLGKSHPREGSTE